MNPFTMFISGGLLGILAVTVLASVILFDGPRIHDIIILILLIYFLFIKDVRRVL